MNKANNLVTSVTVVFGPSHDNISVWNRGGHAGSLVVNAGDGELVAKRLLGNPMCWIESLPLAQMVTWWCCPTCGVVGRDMENRTHHRCD